MGGTVLVYQFVSLISICLPIYIKACNSNRSLNDTRKL